jgi:hypothetical protein
MPTLVSLPLTALPLALSLTSEGALFCARIKDQHQGQVGIAEGIQKTPDRDRNFSARNTFNRTDTPRTA